MINIYVISSVATLIANFFVHIKLMYRFLYSVILNFIVCIYVLILEYFVYVYYFNFKKVCGLIFSYNTDYPNAVYMNRNEAELTCNIHEIYYIYWISSQMFIVMCKGLSIFFAYKAHKKILTKMEEKNTVDEKINEEKLD
jgi:hypothetical protein